MFRLLQWFKLDKAPLVKHIDPETVYLREKMKRKAAQRERVRQRSPESAGTIIDCSGFLTKYFMYRFCICHLRCTQLRIKYVIAGVYGNAYIKLQGTVNCFKDKHLSTRDINTG